MTEIEQAMGELHADIDRLAARDVHPERAAAYREIQRLIEDRLAPNMRKLRRTLEEFSDPSP